LKVLIEMLPPRLQAVNFRKSVKQDRFPRSKMTVSVPGKLIYPAFCAEEVASVHQDTRSSYDPSNKLRRDNPRL